MSRSLIALLLGVVAVGGYSKVAAGEHLGMTIRGWGTVTDPDEDCRVIVEGKRVSITVPGTSHEFAAELERWNAPRVMQDVQGDFIAEVKVCGALNPPPGGGTTKGRKAYNGGGLLLAADPMNHLSIHRAAFRDGDHMRHYLNFSLRRDGRVAAERYSMEVPAEEDCWVRMERHGSRFLGMFSTDSVNWRSYEPIETDFPARARIGVVVVSSTKRPYECTFEEFALFRRHGPGKLVTEPASARDFAPKY
jgi:regulation of enolase protein 1 (concanavalin A-like superfamily)